MSESRSGLRKAGRASLAFLPAYLFALYLFMLIGHLVEAMQKNWEMETVPRLLIDPWLMAIFVYPFALPFVLPFALGSIVILLRRQWVSRRHFLVAGGLSGLCAFGLFTLVAQESFTAMDTPFSFAAALLAGMTGGAFFKLFNER
ncbi:hypothetical protein [Rhizobium paknamense]|uniref:Uncharacterized protein n=1 Tax=Rhizobium paknamense TaxID=1206817 RepID=A0ABU0IDC1_9HYPH|nr:hypothetical protein [Rhizobium paknamense]MDQ0455256.1 hypothetical protein [Rhizobium paknamense]